MAIINGDNTNNSLDGTADPDDISGGAGNDTITAGAGNDVVDGGDASLVSTPLFLDWTTQGPDETDLSAGFTQDTGGINVAVSITDDGGGSSATVQTTQTFVATGEPFDDNSGLGLRGDGGADVYTTNLNFSAVAGSGLAEEVENVTFRIQDIDEAGWQDIVTVNAFDADGNPITVTLTPSGNDTVSGNTITAGPGATGAEDPAGSVLVTIPGPVSRVEIIYENGETSAQLLLVTDVHFDAVPTDDDTIFGEDGDDTLNGGFGNDVIDGGANNDVIDGGTGNDTLLGGANNDTLTGSAGMDSLDGGTGADVLDGGDGEDTLLGGGGFDTLTGGAGADVLDGQAGNDTFNAGSGDTVIGGETGTDTADTLIVNDVDRVEFDPANNENGTVFFDDGTTATFTGIETVIVNGGPDGIVQGSTGFDLIDEDYLDPNIEQVDNNDGTAGTTGDQDLIQAGLGDDTVFAGAANDTVIGGPDAIASGAESLSWIAEGDGTTVNSTGFTQDTGIANITVSVSDDGALNQSNIDNTTQFVDTGEPFATESSLALGGAGGPDVGTVTFQSDTPLENVSFRVNDLDSDTWQDIVTVNAFDPNGNVVPVSFTVTGNETVAGQTISGGPDNDQPNEAAGSVLVNIAGPVARFEVVYENGSTGGQVAYLTDIHYTAVQSDDDLIHGDQGDDSLVGGAGDDTIFGDQLALDPADFASGGAGTPTSVTFQNDSPFAVELAQIDAAGTVLPVITIPAGTSFSPASTTETNWVLRDPETGDFLDLYEAPANGTTLIFDSAGSDTLLGGAGDDVLSGDWGNDSLDGGDDDDSLSGGSGDDTLLGGAGSDTLDGGAGDDTLDGGDDADTLIGGAGNDTLNGGLGADSLDGGTGSDFLSGDAGDDTLIGGAGSDILTGGADNDSLQGGDDADTLQGGLGDDVLEGDAGADSLSGGDGADSLEGGADSDTLDGGAGTDTLNGGAGDDVLRGADDDTGGAAGAADPAFGDIVNGGIGNDTIFANGSDTVDAGEDGDDSDIDVLNVTDVASIQYQDSGGADVAFVTEQGVVTFNDGSTLEFSNVESVRDLNFDGYVEGTSGDDLIDTAYAGDPDDDFIDASDAVLSGEAAEDDIVLAGDGNDTVLGGLGDDEIYGDTQALPGTFGGNTGSSENPWLFEYYDLDPTGDPRTLAQAGFTVDGGRNHSGTPTTTGTTDTITPTAYDTGNDYALKFTSELTVTTGGDYTFATTSDDGSKLFVNGVEVVDNDGHHAAITETGTITLPPGQHIIEIVYYENDGGNALSSTISGPDTGDTTVDLTSYPALLEPGLNTGSGDDSLDGGVGDDIIYGEGGADTLLGGDGQDTLIGGTGADQITGGDGADSINAGDDADTIFAGSGDVIDGGEGGDDNDTLVLNDFDATVALDPGNSENGTVTFGDGSTATFTNIETIVACFTLGSRVETDKGRVPIEELKVGDLVHTQDDGPQSILWIGRKNLSAAELLQQPNLQPVVIRQDSLGPNVPDRDMVVSPQHRMVVKNSATQLWLGEDEVLAKAKHLTHKPGIDILDAGEGVTYIHLMFDQHQLILVDNAWTESFQPGDIVQTQGASETFDELRALFPDLATKGGLTAFPSARPSITRREARLIV